MNHTFRGYPLVEPRTRPEYQERPDWMYHPGRPCADDDRWTSNDKATLNEAAAICHRACPVLQQCRTWALTNGEKHNVWGGLVLSKPTDHKMDKPDPAEPRNDLERQLKYLWAKNLNDTTIALQLNITPKRVCELRKRMLLPSKFRRGGQPRRQVAA